MIARPPAWTRRIQFRKRQVDPERRSPLRGISPNPQAVRYLMEHYFSVRAQTVRCWGTTDTITAMTVDQIGPTGNGAMGEQYALLGSPATSTGQRSGPRSRSCAPVGPPGRLVGPRSAPAPEASSMSMSALDLQQQLSVSASRVSSPTRIATPPRCWGASWETVRVAPLLQVQETGLAEGGLDGDYLAMDGTEDAVGLSPACSLGQARKALEASQEWSANCSMRRSARNSYGGQDQAAEPPDGDGWREHQRR